MNVLVIACHTDDETLGVGGTIAKHVTTGDLVTVCVVCKRAYNHQFDEAWTCEEKKIAARAADTLGCDDIRFLDLPEESIDQRLLDVIIPLEKIVVDVNPSVVYTHHRGDSNQDHRTVLQASLIACRSISEPKVARLLSYEVPSSTDIAAPFPEYAFQPNFYVDVTDFLGRKIEAMECYTKELRRFPHPRSVEGIQVLAKKRGMEIGFEAAEAFVVIRDQWA